MSPESATSPELPKEDGGFESKWRQHKACARCHRLKMKCAYSSAEFKACKRCFAIGVECSPDVDPTAKYAKRRKVLVVSKPKRSSSSVLSSLGDSSVENIAILVEALNNELASLGGSQVVLEQRGRLKDSITTASLTLHKIYENIGEDFNHIFPHIPYAHNVVKDIILLKGISMHECKQRFHFFMDEMLPYYPIISFSSYSKDFQHLLDNYPLLLLACVLVTYIHDNGFLDSLDGNKRTEKFLRHYLEKFLSYRLYIQADGFGIRLIQIYIILSVWLPPPNKLGHFKNQVNLLCGLNIALCMGLGHETVVYDEDESDNSEERNDLRTFLSVYCNCGSLGLSLQRFKLVSWSSNHDIALSKLQRNPKLITRGDSYLIYYTKSIKLSQDIYQTLGIGKKNQSKLGNLPINGAGVEVPFSNLSVIVHNYESQLFNLLRDSGFSDSTSKEASVLAILYYQVLLAMYDKLFNVHFSESKDADSAGWEVTHLNLISKLITICENLLNSYIQMNAKTVNYPTFLYYRPMHALVFLIRLRLLSKAEALGKAGALKINVEYYFKMISSIITDNQQKFNLEINFAMKDILLKIEKWLKVSEEYSTPADPQSLPLRESRSSLLINLMDKSRHQEIEALEAPHEALDKSMLQLPNRLPPPINPIATNAATPPHTSIQELFEEIDIDVMNYLNLLETNSVPHYGDNTNGSAYGSLFNEGASYFANFFSQ